MNETNSYQMLTPYSKKIEKLGSTLKNKYPNNYIIPCSHKKNPIFCHKNGKYNWEFLENPINNVIFQEKGYVGIILNDLVVIDIDDKQYISLFETKFDFMKNVVSEITENGKHYYFKRTPLCDELNIYTAVKPLIINDVVADIDIKTNYSNGTGSIIICDPSPKKEWINTIYENDITDIPEELVNYLKSHWKEENPKKEKKEKKTKEGEKNEIKKFVEKNFDNEKTKFDFIIDLTNIIKPYKNNSYDDWIKVGWCIYNITFGSQEGLEIWDNFSKDSEKYIKNNCKKYWSKMTLTKDGYNEASLRWWAKNSDINEYNHFLGKNIENHLHISLQDDDFHIAKVIAEYYKDEFYIFTKSSGRLDQCWRFYNHKWIPNQVDVLKNKIDTEIYDLYKNIAKKYELMADNTTNEDEKENLKNISLKFFCIGKKLLNTTSFNNIFTKVRSLMSKDLCQFITNINENPYLIGFENGVYDLLTNTFRDGKPDDYITFSTKYDYTDVIDEEIQKDIKNILWSAFEDEETYQFILDSLSYALCGNKNLEMYIILYGEGGRNGKGVKSKLCSFTFGDYYSEVKANNFTDPKDNKGGTDSEIYQLKGKRLVISSEPSKTAKLQLNRIKEWTGGDLIKARGLYVESIQFKCQFLIEIQANHPPSTSSYKDRANEKRLNVVPYKIDFVEEPINDNERKIDRTIKDKFENNIKYRQQFMLMLLENYKKIWDNEKNTFNIRIAKQVENATKELLLQNNEFMLWFDENYVKVNDNKLYVKKTGIYDVYKTENPHVKKNTFYKYMEENGFKLFKLNGIEVYRGITASPNNRHYLFHHDDDE